MDDWLPDETDHIAHALDGSTLLPGEPRVCVTNGEYVTPHPEDHHAFLTAFREAGEEREVSMRFSIRYGGPPTSDPFVWVHPTHMGDVLAIVDGSSFLADEFLAIGPNGAPWWPILPGLGGQRPMMRVPTIGSVEVVATYLNHGMRDYIHGGARIRVEPDAEVISCDFARTIVKTDT